MLTRPLLACGLLSPAAFAAGVSAKCSARWTTP
jgi:hypothetical protein